MGPEMMVTFTHLTWENHVIDSQWGLTTPSKGDVSNEALPASIVANFDGMCILDLVELPRTLPYFGLIYAFVLCKSFIIKRPRSSTDRIGVS